MRNNLWLFMICCFFSTAIMAQQPTSSKYSFSLQEAIDFALEHSYTSLNARRDVAKALQRKWETTATGLPQINAKVDYQNQLKQPVSFLPAAAFDPFSQIRNLEDYYNVTPNPNNPVPDVPDGFIPIVFSPKQQVTATATLTQLIFDGSYLVGLKAAKSFLNYTYTSEEKTQLDVRKGIINAYGSVLLAKEIVAVTTNNKETLEKNLSDITQVFENGLEEEESVEQLQITLAQIESQLNNAKRTEAIAIQMLNLALGLDVETQLSLTDELETLTQQNMDIALTKSTFSIENNIDYKLAYLLTEQRSLELKLEKSRALPTVSAFVNYGTNSSGDKFTFFDSDQRWFQSSIFGASVNIPIFSSLGRASKTKQAKIALEQANTQFTEVQQQIKLGINRAKSDFQFAVENYSTSKKNLTLAERIENKNQIKFKEGLATSFELRQAQLQLYSAQQESLSAMLDIILKKAELETILNTPSK